jgi:alpha-D-xyloside xylohydrolase
MRQTHELPRFLDDSVPVALVTALLAARLDGQSLLMRCALSRYEPTLHNYYGTLTETTFAPPQPSGEATVRLEFCGDATLRLRFGPGETVSEHPSPMLVGAPDAPVALELEEDDATLTVRSATLRVVVTREPWQLAVYDNTGELIWRSSPVDIDCLRRPAQQWNPPEQRWIFLHRYAYPLGFADHGGRRQAFASFDLRHDERIYGFGESFGRLDKRGTQQRLWLQEAFSNASPASYKQAPFFMSTRGYGMFVHTANAVAFNMGSLEHTTASVLVDQTTELDLYLIYGPSLREILPRYTALTGAPAVPPRWSFGLWMGRITYRSQGEVEAVARALRAHAIPCDVIHIDTGWFAREWVCDLEFGAENFPDPAAMLARLRDQGFRVCLWQWPNLVLSSPMFAEALEQGYLARRANGKPYLFPGFEEDAGIIDYSNPAAVAWVQAKLQRLFALGVAAIKADFGEGAPPDARYAGADSAAMHNLYPLLYNQALFEASERALGRGEALIWARSAWAGSQRYPLHWSGDGVARFEDLACVLRAALGFGLSGFPFYSHDIGGFSGVPSPALYVRWAQLGLFSSHARAHGTPPREPWAYGDAAETIVRNYVNLRYRLLPYIFSEALGCGETSLPMLRALILEFQEDRNAHQIEDQYMFGGSIMVAPILDEREQRAVYLPQGDWVEYWSKELLSGGRWLDVQAPLDRLPLFVRAGAILPLGPLAQTTAACTLDPLTVEIYAPSASGRYVVHPGREDAVRIAYQRNGEQLHVSVDGAPGQVELIVYGSRSDVTLTINGQPARAER